MFALILQPHWWVYFIWKTFRPKWQWNSETGIVLTSIILTLFERFTPQQFPTYVGSPWLHLAPYLGLTPHLGSVAFSFFTYWMCLEFLFQIQNKKPRFQVWIISISFILINIFFPLTKNEHPVGEIKLRIVQANIGNFIKVASEFGDQNSFQAVRKKYFNLSTQKTKFNPDLIIWPETAYPDTFFSSRTIVNNIFLQISNLTGAELLIGGYDQDITKPMTEIIESVYNASLLISDNKVKSSYHKNILIPFGETLPFGPLNREIVSILPAISLFARGEGTPKMETKTGFRFITPICYEILETNYMRYLLNEWKNNHFIVNHTNDSWYGDTAEPYQHLFLSKWRALEFQIPIIRSTNTGISSVIFPDGSESKRLGIGEEKILDMNLSLSKPENSLYQIFGAIPLLCIVFLITLFTWFRERNGNPP